jgi:hypothetical protein
MFSPATLRSAAKSPQKLQSNFEDFSPGNPLDFTGPPFWAGLPGHKIIPTVESEGKIKRLLSLLLPRGR